MPVVHCEYCHFNCTSLIIVSTLLPSQTVRKLITSLGKRRKRRQKRRKDVSVLEKMLDDDHWTEMSSYQWESVTVSLQHLWVCAHTGPRYESAYVCWCWWGQGACLAANAAHWRNARWMCLWENPAVQPLFQRRILSGSHVSPNALPLFSRYLSETYHKTLKSA